MWKHTTTDRDGLMDVTEIDLRGLRMSPDGVTAALATMPPHVALGLERRAYTPVVDVDAQAVGPDPAPTGHEFTTPWQLPAVAADH
jgi:hypothetical protein